MVIYIRSYLVMSADNLSTNKLFLSVDMREFVSFYLRAMARGIVFRDKILLLKGTVIFFMANLCIHFKSRAIFIEKVFSRQLSYEQSRYATSNRCQRRCLRK